MISPRPDRRRGPRPETTEVTVSLTADQARDFVRCARVAGVELEQWIIECAAVQAANAIDAMQATARRTRAAAIAENETVNARNRERRRARRIASKEPRP